MIGFTGELDIPDLEAVADLPEEANPGFGEGDGEWVYGCTIGYLTPSLKCGGMHVALGPIS